MDIYKAPKSNLDTQQYNNSGRGKNFEPPEGVTGWSWGAFFLNWIWAIGNKTWIGLLALFPYFGIVMAIILGIYGRRWAWQNKQWDDVDHFLRVQKKWSFWGTLIVIVPAILGILAAIIIPQLVELQ